MEDRLLSLLASANFSVSHYLNLALAAPPPTADDDVAGENDGISAEERAEQALEQRMASLALQLQMRTQSCHDEIGRIGAELQAVVPRCAADVGRLRVGLEGMELDVRGLLEGMDGDAARKQRGGNSRKGEDMSASAADASAGGADLNKNRGDDPLATLHSLLNLRTHLTTSRAILSAASSWDETINSVPMLLSTTPPNLVEAVAALSQLERGARALRGMPEGRDEREAALRKLRTQLEVLLKPQLLHALKRMDTRLGPLQQCVGMYVSLGKMESMREEYVRMRPVEIHALWFSFGGGTAGNFSSGNVESKESDEKSDNGDEGGESKNQEEVEDFDFEDAPEESTSIATDTTQQQRQITANQFMEFLPSFYEAVLELLSKERTQSKLVFGPDLAPSITARVLMECFSPIVDSFGKRLGNLCPPPGAKSGGVGGTEDGMGGAEAIAAAYESTIQFLSLAYDQMEAWNGCQTAEKGNDSKKIKSSSSPKDPDAAAHKEEDMSLQFVLRSAFLLISSPFVPYQRGLASIERDPMLAAASMVAKDVRGVSNFEDAAERLGDLAPFMFPLVEATMTRFELLNSGYNAPATLSSIDVLLSNHASELAIAMGTLSTNASSARSSGPEFDDQHVHCALEILRIAGLFKRNLQSFEYSVKGQLRTLSDEIMMVDDILDAIIPDDLAPVQIRALLAKAACDPSSEYIDDGTGVKCPTTVVELRRLAGPASNSSKKESMNPSPPLFPKALDSTSRLSRSCLSFVFEVCSAIPERQLHGISALPVWRRDSALDDDEASYGILPQPFITHVGEHMLALVQALEPFASDPEALGLANEVMKGVLEVAVQPWKEFVAAAGCSFKSGNEKSQLEILMRGKDLSKYFLDDDDEDPLEEDAGDGGEDEEEDAEAEASAAFCNQWLDVVGLAVTGRLLERAMRIPRLGRRGAEHLATDLNYIRNVFTALGVAGHPHPLLGYVAQLVTLEDVDLRSKIQRRRQCDAVETSSEALEVIKRAELRVAYVRSISV